MRTLLPLLVALAMVGCKKDDDKDPKDTGTPAEETFTFEFNVVDEVAPAGAQVGYTAEIVSSLGDRYPVEPTLASDLEPAMAWDAASLTATVAGDHTIAAEASLQGVTYTASDTLTVEAGLPASIDLLLDDMAMTAGTDLGWSVVLADAWGNLLPEELASVIEATGTVTVGDGFLECVVPGSYTLTAMASGDDGAIEDSEFLQVYAGAPSSMELTLSDPTPELNGTTTASVIVWDAFGNEVDADWSLYVEAGTGSDAANVAISYNNLTFYAEGIYTVVATVASDGLSDSVGPLTVDSTGPDLVIDQPGRGSWSTAYSYTESGTATDAWSGVSSLTVQGVPVSVGSGGEFSSNLALAFGTNLVETVATDGDGNVTEDKRAVVAGTFYAYGGGVPDGIVARLNQGGFDTLEGLAEGIINTTDLSAVIPSPAYSNKSEDCWDWGWLGSGCITYYGVDLYVTNPRFSGTDFQIDPVSGSLYTTFAVYDAALDYSATGELMDIGYSASGTVSASSITVAMYVTPSVSGGELYVTVTDVTVSTAGLSVRLDSWLQDVLDFFGVDLGSMVQGYLEDGIKGAIESEVPSLLQDALNDLELATSLPVLENTYALNAVPSSVSVDDNGLSLGLQTYFTASSWVSPYSGPGSLYGGFAVPAYTDVPGMVLSIGVDFLNQALYAFWGGGVLDMELAGADLGLDPSMLSTLFPDVTDVNIVTRALLPPNVVPGTGASLLDLQLGDYEVTLYGGPTEPGYEILQAYVTVFGGLDLAVTDAYITPSLAGADVWFDVVLPESNTLAAADTEALLDALVPMLLPYLTSALSSIPVPEIEGFTLSGISVSLAGAGNGYVNAGGDLVVTP